MNAAPLLWTCAILIAAVCGADAAARDLNRQQGFLRAEFIYEKAPFPQCHASTIVQTKAALVAAWFGGTRERNPDVGIWVSRNEGKGWSAPVEAANGIESPTKRHPCWNPVLFLPRRGAGTPRLQSGRGAGTPRLQSGRGAGTPRLQLFYKVGPSPSTWWGMLATSSDQGKTWSEPRRLPDGIWGPIKNKPVQLPDGSILCPTSGEATGWQVFLQRTADLGKTWESIGPLNDRTTFAAIQPTILTYPKGRMQILCRSRQGKITQCWSSDGGKTWGKMTATALPNPNSGIDAVTLADGRQLLVYNHTTIRRGKWGGPRSPLNVAVSDDGTTWKAALVLENKPGEYSYPAVIQTADRLVHTTYTWKRRRVKHVVIDPAKLVPRPMPDGRWPK